MARRSLLRYSLMSLLGVTFVFAVMFACIGNAVRRARQEAVLIDRYNLVVEYREERVPLFLRWTPRDSDMRTRVLSLRVPFDSEMPPGVLNRFDYLYSITFVDISGSYPPDVDPPSVSSEVFEELARQPNLTVLNLSREGIDPDVLLIFQECPQIQAIGLSNMTLGNRHMQILAAMPHLADVFIGACTFEDEDDILLLTSCRELQHIVVERPGMSKETAQKFQKARRDVILGPR